MFDPYHKWLGIPRDQRPPTYYQLLGISPDEQDVEVIEEAALMRIAHLRNYQLGPHAEECSRLLRELGEANETLCDPEKRAVYHARVLPEHKAEPVSQSLGFPQSQGIDIPPAAHKETEPASPFPSPPPQPQQPSPPDETFPRPAPRYPAPPAQVPPEPAPPKAVSRSSSPEPVSAHRPEDVILQELSNEALSDLRRPLDPEAETFRELAGQLLRDWSEQLPPRWLVFLRRLRVVLVLVVLAVVVFYLAQWLF